MSGFFGRIFLGLFAATAPMLLATTAIACTAKTMERNEAGFVLKVIPGSDQIDAYTDTSEATAAFRLDLMEPYFVICREGDFFRITNINTLNIDEAEAGKTGFVRNDQVFVWSTREALSFATTAFIAGRPEIVAWDDPSVLKGFMETGNARANPPAFRENIDATLKRERSVRPYPVQGSTVTPLMGSPKRVYNVLVPTAIRPSDMIVVDDKDTEALEKVLTSAAILVVFDATGSMAPFARETAQAIRSAIASLPEDVRNGSQMGFVFYRDVEDKENLVEMPMMSLADASRLLDELAAKGYMTGGGDGAEPVLDAVYYGQYLYKWGEQVGKRIMVAVLSDDAKPATIGTLTDGQGRIPAGLGAVEIAGGLVEAGMQVITVQSGPNKGPNLDAVLSTLAEETRSTYLQWGAAGVDVKSVAQSLTLAMTSASGAAIGEGKKTLTEVGYDVNGFPTIPLEVLDGEKLERLRAAGVKFNVVREKGGVLVQEAFMLENTDLLEPNISIEKETMERLINLFTVLSTTGVDGEGFRALITEAVAAIAGEEFDPETPIKDIVEKQLGIQFRTDLLNFNIEFVAVMSPAERNVFAKRIQDAAKSMSQFFDANLKSFDTEVAVWMPVARLP